MKPRIDAVAVVVALVAIGFGGFAVLRLNEGMSSVIAQGTLATILIFSGAIGLLAVRPPRKRKEIR